MSPDLPYSPIACALHDHLEAAATTGRPCRIVFRDAAGAAGAPQEVYDRIADLFARGGAEFLLTAGGTEVRLDHLESVGGVSFTASVEEE